jgi:hypothetical protein
MKVMTGRRSFGGGLAFRSFPLACRHLRVAAAFVVLLPSGVVFAQEVRDEPLPATPAPQLKRSEDLVVTATRSERSVEDVPVSVTVVPCEAIEKAPSRTLDDDLWTVVFFVSHPLTGTLELFASGENFLDRQYVSEVNVGRRLGPPRALFADLRLRQLLPALGASTPTIR